MVFTANDLLGWTDFPKGLRVLLLDEDSSSASEIRSKLEEMDYVVSTFCNANEAMTAISNKPESFHVAIVEVSTGNSSGRFKFLEVAKDLPTIMTSNMQCLATMMKCIALGAVEFLLKPLSDDKLRNIWQHAAHKAFNAGDKDLSVSLKPVKESVVSMLHLQLGNEEAKSSISVKTENEIRLEENDQEHSEGSDKYPAPPTPQLKQGVRLVDDGDCHDQTNFSLEKEGGDQEGESKSVDLTSCDLSAEISVQECHTQVSRETVNKGEDEATGGFKSEGHMSSGPQNKHGPSDSGGGDAGNLFNAPGIRNLNGNKANRKKTKVDWTPELHKKFVQAVEKLGVDQAIPSRILDLMNVDGLTRHNIASHLQKYRMQRRHILPKEDDRRWPNPRVASQRIYYPQNPAIAFPPYYSNHTVPGGQVYPAWGYTGSYPSGVQMWRPAFYPPWQATEGWHWDPYPGVHADAWGCPVVPPSHHSPCGPHLPFTQYTNGFHNANRTHGSYGMPHSSYDLHPAEEVVDKVVKEAISKPWLPLPIGLNPPSTDSVLTELSKQGISTVPPY